MEDIAERLKTEFSTGPLPELMEIMLDLLAQAEMRQRIRSAL